MMNEPAVAYKAIASDFAEARLGMFVMQAHICPHGTYASC